MVNNNCLNCGTELSGKFCSNCGQSANTHRITFKHFIFHTVLHGTFHFEKGMLFTAKQALVRPGKSALEYIAGKRINYYNVFYFILILIGLNLVLSHFFDLLEHRLLHLDEKTAKMNETGKQVYQLFSNYGKLFIFALIPLTSINSFLLFKRKKLNLTEHFVLSGMWLLGVCLLVTFFFILKFTELGITSEKYRDNLPLVFMGIVPLFVLYAYFDAFRSDYKLVGFIGRMLLFTLLLLFEFYVVVLIIIGLLTNWQGGDVVLVL